MSKRIEDMTDKDIKEYIESDEGKAAQRRGFEQGLNAIMECLRRNQEQSLKSSGLKNE
jgi:hypothetical protein